MVSCGACCVVDGNQPPSCRLSFCVAACGGLDLESVLCRESEFSKVYPLVGDFKASWRDHERTTARAVRDEVNYFCLTSF